MSRFLPALKREARFVNSAQQVRSSLIRRYLPSLRVTSWDDK